MADDSEPWLVLIVVKNHLKMVGETMKVLHGKKILVEGQLEIIKNLRYDLEAIN